MKESTSYDFHGPILYGLLFHWRAPVGDTQIPRSSCLVPCESYGSVERKLNLFVHFAWKHNLFKHVASVYPKTHMIFEFLPIISVTTFDWCDSLSLSVMKGARSQTWYKTD